MSDHRTSPDPIEDFIELLEGQKRSHRTKCAFFTTGFVTFLLLSVAIGVPIGLGAADLLPVPDRLATVLGSVIGPVLGFAMLFLTAWMSTESCLSALDASLFAARRRNQPLMEKLFDRVDCAGKKGGGALDAVRTIIGA